MDIMDKLMNVDFSKNSKVKESLYQKLMANRNTELLSDEELDQVVAAGVFINKSDKEI